MKGVIALLLLWLALLAAGWWGVAGSRDTSLVESTLAEKRVDFAKIPMEGFLRDRANILEGRVLDPEGGSIEGAAVDVYVTQELFTAAANTDLGGWPDPETEVSGVTGADGSYRFTDLSYGSKYAVFRKDGRLVDLDRELVFADGYGAKSVDGTLEQVSELIWALKGPDGKGLPGVPVRFLPRTWGLPAVESVSANGGQLTVPSATRSTDGEPRLIVGSPGILVQGPSESGDIQLPAASELVVTVEGGKDGTASLRVYPEGARRCGAVRGDVEVRGGRIVLPGLFHGGYEILLRQNGRSGRVEGLHDGSGWTLNMRPDRDLVVKIDRKDTHEGETAAFQCGWQLRPFRPGSPFGMDPLVAVEASDPARVLFGSDELGQVVFKGLPDVGGYLLIEAAHAPPVLHELKVGDSQVTVDVPHGIEVSLRTQRAFLPVEVHVEGHPVQTGRTDAAGESFAWAMPGPLIARSGFALRGRSYPKGYMVGHSTKHLDFSLLDDRGRPRGCVYGFVTMAGGHPVEKATVYLQSAGAPDNQKTDEHGFFRFTGLKSNAYSVFVIPNDDFNAVRSSDFAQLFPVGPEEEGEARVDLVIHPGVILVVGVPAGDETRVDLLDEKGEVFWSARSDEPGLIRVGNLEPGVYQVIGFTAREGSGMEIGTATIVEGVAEPVQLNWGAR